MKRKILFIYPEMIIGGSTTSLLSILSLIDYNKFEVDIQFQYHIGELGNLLPKQINILPFALNKSRKYYKYRKLFSFRALTRYVYSKSIGGLAKAQCMQQENVKYTKQNSKHYDIAISFLELWSLYYLVDKVSAKKKIAWIHVDYTLSGLYIKFDIKYFQCVDKIVFVSEQCLTNFQQQAPALSSKTVCIRNILDAQIIRKRSIEETNVKIDFLRDEEIFKLISVSRISFNHKGLDRGVNAFRILKEKGLLENVVWYIIGKGPDFEPLKNMITEAHLENHIKLLGESLNPFCIEKYCDVFFLPSHYEGKPMAVTEAQMLGLVPLITNISSAHEIVENYSTGIICDNNDEGILNGLEYVLLHKEQIKTVYKKRIQNINYTNLDEFCLVDQLLKL